MKYKNDIQRALAVLQLAAAGELTVKYIGAPADVEPFAPDSDCFANFRIGRRYTLVAFNDCGCFDYIDAIYEDDRLIWEDHRGDDVLDYLTAAEQESLDKLLRAGGSLPNCERLRVLVPAPYDEEDDR